MFRHVRLARSAQIRWFGGALSLVLISSFLAAPVAAQPAASNKPTAVTRSPEATAMAKAQETGQPVEIPEKTTETSRTIAQPEGHLTLEQSAVPLRVHRGATWVPIDTTLTRQPDGSVTPGATVVPVKLSGGGSSPLATVRARGVTFQLTWPKPLGTPRLNADTATYPEVLTGVDLVIRAMADGISPVFVVKSAAAASQPELRRLTFNTAVTGGVSRVENNGLTVADKAGIPALLSPQPLMWDSTGMPSGKTAATDPVGEGLSGPSENDLSSEMGLEGSQQQLTVVPDATMLSSPSTRYPLFIDPVISATRTSWAMVNRSFPGTEYYKWSGTEGMGYTNKEGTHLKRLFWAFSLSAVSGRTIRDAQFKAYETFADSCTATNVSLWLTYGINSGTNWSNQPKRYAGHADSTRTVAYGRTDCTPGGAWVEFNAKQSVTAGAANWGAVTVGLYADNEGASSGWKRFRPDAVLSVDYNTTPNTPTILKTTSPTTTCVTGANRPIIPNDLPRLWARIADADTSYGQKLYPVFELWHTGGAKIAEIKDGLPHSPGDAYVDMTQFPNLTGPFSWRVRVWDGLTWSQYSTWCEFSIDPTAPTEPTITPPTNPNYAVGVDSSFGLGSGASTDVTRYDWSLQNTVPKDVSGATATALVRPLSFGPNTLTAHSFDAAGNSSPPARTTFVVPGAQSAGRWKLDEGSGTTAADAELTGRPLTLTAGASWGPGRENDTNPADGGLVLDGVVGSAASAASVVRTDDNFSIAGFGILADSSRAQTVISQDAASGSVFSIGYDGAGAAVFAVQTADGRTVTSTMLLPSTEPEWFHYAGVYTAADGGSITLYVNGDPADATAVGGPLVPSSGPLRIGAARSGANPAGFWKGNVDDVRTFAGALTDQQVAELQYRPPGL